MRVTNFEEQYNKAKIQALEAIDKEINVVLLGGGCNGKSYLTRYLFEEGLLKNYYPCFDYPIDYCNERLSLTDIVKENNKNKFWFQTNSIEIPLKALKNENYMLINMNEFRYPTYSKLRSGRVIK